MVNVKEQYVGDINDYRKYALLRALADGGRIKIGVCWMLTADDNSGHGSDRAYLSDPERNRHSDPELFDILASLPNEHDSRWLIEIEQAGTVPGATYFNDHLTDDLRSRTEFWNGCLRALADRDLVFLDPDNGLEVQSVKKGRKNSSKYVYLDEVRDIFASEKSVLIYQHFPRKPRDQFIADSCKRLKEVAPNASTLTFRTSKVVFLLLVHPVHDC